MQTNFGLKFLRYAKSVALAGLFSLSACGGGGGGGIPAVFPSLPAAPTLRSVEVSPANSTIASGTSIQLAATAIYSDNTHADVTSRVTWTSATPTVATVDQATAAARGVAPGTALIKASLDGQSGSANVKVIAATVVSIAITPATSDIVVGTTAAFMATATFTDNSTQNITNDIVWTSSIPVVAAVSASGIASGIAPGKVTVTATCAAVSLCPAAQTATATLNVSAAILLSIALTPATPSIALGTTQQFSAVGTYNNQTTQDLTTQVGWVSGTPSVASVDVLGLATSVSAGSTNITASLGSVTSSAVVLIVTPATLVSMVVTPATSTVLSGSTRQFAATGTYTDGSTQDITLTATWASAQPAVATISNASGTNGLATGVAAIGSTTITASVGTVSADATLQIQQQAVFSVAGATTWTVPAGVTSVRIEATGAGGGGGTFAGGNGGRVTTTLIVNGGDVLNLFVGGGGAGGTYTGGGGGATSVNAGVVNQIIAGAGGGSGYGIGGDGTGGDGGGNGTAAGSKGGHTSGGLGGNGGIGGAGGTTTSGAPGTAGGNGNGGAGGAGGQGDIGGIGSGTGNGGAGGTSAAGGGGGGGYGGGGGGGSGSSDDGGGGGGGSVGPTGAVYSVAANKGAIRTAGGGGSITIDY